MSISRRRFVTTATAGLVGAGAGLRAQGAARSGGKSVAPTDRVTVALIGCGGMGKSNLRDFIRMKEVQVAAVCDVWDHNRGTAATIAGEGAKQVSDFRRVVDMQDVDVVIVSTPDHWHAIPTIAALDAGKDVYVEKPLAHNIYEGRKIVEAAARNKRVDSSHARAGHETSVAFGRRREFRHRARARCGICRQYPESDLDAADHLSGARLRRSVLSSRSRAGSTTSRVLMSAIARRRSLPRFSAATASIWPSFK